MLFDPDPTVMPDQVAAMNFMSRSRGGDAERNAKSLMRRDTDKDGLLSREELGKRMKEIFDAADANEDQRVSFQELLTKLEADEAAAAVKADAESEEQETIVEPAPSNSDQPNSDQPSESKEAGGSDKADSKQASDEESK